MPGTNQDQGKRLALVTGATGAIGKAIATGITSQPGYRVVLLCRDEQRASQAVSEVQEQSGNKQVRCVVSPVHGCHPKDELIARMLCRW